MNDWNLVNKALQRVSHLCNNGNIPLLRAQLERVNRMSGANRIFMRIASASDIDQLEDYFTEVRYALIFAGLGFQVGIEPFGSKGPDLSVSQDGDRTIVEVTRFRKIYAGPPPLEGSGKNLRLSEYGNPGRDIRKAFGKLQSKIVQVEGEQAIIAIWNDDGELDDLEVGIAVKDLCDDADRGNLSLPQGLLFVLYASPYTSVKDQKQFYCFPLRHADRLQQINWERKFERSTVRMCIERALGQQTDGA